MLVENSTGPLKPNSTVVLTLCRTFAIFKKLGVKANELEGLLAQATCHALPTLNQLVTATILAKGNEKPSSTFVGQVILNTFEKNSKFTQFSSPFIYHVSDPPESFPSFTCPHSPHFSRPMASMSNVCHPPEHLVDKFGRSCFHCRYTEHWQADCPRTKEVTNPNLQPTSPGPFCPVQPGTPDHQACTTSKSMCCKSSL
ncbi:hypothetical protein O181_036458 [Austropuccinia psidii MF-1]|uniref:CCHC-type domain-containing protein n=1 Tax=Austropuccinia psidii MF-1 TaxID=1389203 RepID=A0A9Q3D7H0_9BASI|nr:hypothetical protein [Austropuccinia psidii MF-1]